LYSLDAISNPPHLNPNKGRRDIHELVQHAFSMLEIFNRAHRPDSYEAEFRSAPLTLTPKSSDTHFESTLPGPILIRKHARQCQIVDLPGVAA
jgi:hypothetical protein